MSKRPLRCVMVGGGPDSFMGPVHRQAMGMYGLAATVGGVFSRKPEKNAAMAEILRVPEDDIFADLDALIAALPRLKPDFAVVITPTPDHYEPVIRLLKAGLPVVCDKPLCSTVAEAEEIADLAERLHLPMMVTYTYAGYAMTEEARDLVARGVLGSIRMVFGEYKQESLARSLPNAPGTPRAWRFDSGRAAAFCVEDIGVHLEYLIRHITGQAPQELSARLHSFTPGLKLDDNAFILATLDKGAEVSAVCSKVCVGSHNSIVVQVIGDKGSLEWRHSEPELLRLFLLNEPERVLRRGEAGLCERAKLRSRVPAEHPQGYMEAFCALYTDFCTVLGERAQGIVHNSYPFPTARDGALGVRFVHACLNSHQRNGQRVAVVSE